MLFLSHEGKETKIPVERLGTLSGEPTLKICGSQSTGFIKQNQFMLAGWPPWEVGQQVAGRAYSPEVIA